MNTSQSTDSDAGSKVVCVDPPYVLEFWRAILPGLWLAVRNSYGCERTVERVKKNLVSGEWGLWLVVDDGIEGFAITEVLTDDDGWWLNIPFAHSRGRIDTHSEFFNHIVPQVKEWGGKGVKFCSGRKGYERVARKHGWKVRFKEYIVEEF